MNHSLFQPAHPDEEKLISFADMLFEGKLTSILVCQKCKHISQTYEDFNDLSLSIKAEDYARERTRNRLKNLAKKFKNLHGTSLSLGLELQRSSSVPASPSANVDGPFTDEPPIVEPRRRSLDYVEVAKKGSGGGDGDTIELTETSTTVPADNDSGRVELAGGLDRKVEHVEFTEPLRLEKKDKKVKDDDGWARLGRRISMKVTKKTKDKDDRHSRSMDLGRGRRSADLDTVKEKDSGYHSSSVSSPGSTATMSSPQQQPGSDGDPSPVSPPEANRPKLENIRSISFSPALPTSTTSTIPPQSSSNRFPLISRASSPSKPGRRAKSPQPPKTTAEEAAYLRQVLADITPASSNSFGIFKPPVLQSGGGNMSSTATNLLLKIGQLPGIEECLRMFTAVEVLDGENMVGCRRCWKVANGEYKPKVRPQDSDSDESEKSDGTAAKPDANPDQPGRVAFDLERASPPPQSSSPSASASSSIASLDAQSGSIYNTPSSSPSDDALPLSQPHSTSKTPPPLPLTLNGKAPTLGVSEPRMTTYGGMSIPVISTTAPESPFSPLTTAKATSCFPGRPSFTDHFGLAEALAAPLPVKDSLRAPKFTRHRRMPGDADSTTESADESSDDTLDSDASGSMLSDSSSIGSRAASPVVTPGVSVERLSVVTQSTPSAPPKVPRSKQVIMRPAFKRYLIATPPPVLVIHLKRFQQVSKTPMMSFSSGFKKLEDVVAFPESLDIGPFIAPRKEDFGLGKGSRLKTSKRAGRCMYRLYAVVVHIGNMVCFNLTIGLIVCSNEKP
jgi:hypothetical protein